MTVPSTQVTTLLTQFNLTTASEELVPRLTQAGHHDALPVLLEVFEAEAEARRQRRMARLRRASRLPPGKTFETLDTGRLPGPLVQQLKTLASGAFLETATNVLAFGLPGVGKSHGLCAVGHALVEAGRSVLCVPAYALVQELLGAKRDLDLPRALRKLDLFEVILLDDLGYVQQSPDEAEVLFTLLAERYEQRSIPLRIGTEQVGAQADAPAIDRHRDVHVLVGIDPDNHRLRFVQVRHAVRHCRLLGLRRWLVRAGGQDCDRPFVRQAPIGSRPIRSASYRMIRRWAMTDRSKRGHEVSQLEGQAITHRHPPVSPSDTDRRENDAHSQLAIVRPG